MAATSRPVPRAVAAATSGSISSRRSRTRPRYPPPRRVNRRPRSGQTEPLASLEVRMSGRVVYPWAALVVGFCRCGAHACQAGLPEDRAEDMVLAIHELAANAVHHGAGTGRLRLWRRAGTVCCQIDDGDRLASEDPAEQRVGHGEGDVGMRWRPPAVGGCTHSLAGRATACGWCDNSLTGCGFCRALAVPALRSPSTCPAGGPDGQRVPRS